MKIIEPSVELIDDVNQDAVLAKIERCGRVCYQSEPKGNPASFVRMLIKRGHESVLEHVSLTFHIITDRAIQNELVRHRLASFCVESTRYVKYNELVTVQENDIVYNGMAFWTENAYKGLLQQGYPPEIARAVLPLCTKSELYMTANLREWRYILKLRTGKAAHPQMRQLAGIILQIFKEKLPVIVEDFKE